MTDSHARLTTDPYKAHLAPFAAFMLLLSVPETFGDHLAEVVGPALSDFAARPMWLYPLQTAICFALLLYFRNSYPWKPVKGILLAVVTGVLGIALWLLPGALFQHLQITFPFSDSLGLIDRSEGFDPVRELQGNPFAVVWFWGWRILRLVVVVPIIEEVFWRSFLMRFLQDSQQEFYQAEFGRHSMMGLGVVTAMFVVAHQPADYFGAVCFGLLAYWLTVRTKSLTAVIVMHAVANAGLAAYAVAFQQWGYL